MTDSADLCRRFAISTGERGVVSVSTIKVSKDQASRFLIARQRYHAYGNGFTGEQAVRDAIRHLEAVQIDPINVFERNHHQALFCRVEEYQPGMLEHVLYKQNLGFEYYCNALCVLPVEDFPYFRYAMQQRSQAAELSPELRQAMQDVLEHIAGQGAVASRELNSGQRIKGWWDADEKTKLEKQALDYLHMYGQVLISDREGVQRRYNLPEGLLSEQLLGKDVNEQEYRQFMLTKFLRAYGLSQTSLFRFGWYDAPKAEKRALLRQLIDQGDVLEVQVEGVKRPYYCPTSLLPELCAAETPLPAASQAVFLPPLDNLLWDRDRLAELFEFDYRWEVYTPASKRKYGYYVIPVLHGEGFIGRIELKALRQEGVLSVLNLWWEQEYPAARQAVRDAVQQEADYLGLAVRWECTL